MQDFNHILNWKLLAGSHQFPGPHGGTCINEAAIVAAGFEYRQVKSAADCPSCFCPVLSQFAIAVNDMLPDDERQALMGFVTRLAGSKDEPWAELARARFIRDALLDARLPDIISALIGMGAYNAVRDLSPGAAARTLNEAERALDQKDSAKGAYLLSSVVGAVSVLLRNMRGVRLVEKRELGMVNYLMTATSPTETILWEDVTSRTFGLVALEALERAFQIGRRAPEADTAEIVERMEKAKSDAPRGPAFV